MSGETDLPTLLQHMEPVKGDDYAFCVITPDALRKLPIEALATCHEPEGLTAVFPVQFAELHSLTPSYVGTLITLNVHSSLNAVGFLAAITTKLASAGISVNAFSPVYHDHLFVKPEEADEAIRLLKDLSAGA